LGKRKVKEDTASCQ